MAQLHRARRASKVRNDGLLTTNTWSEGQFNDWMAQQRLTRFLERPGNQGFMLDSPDGDFRALGAASMDSVRCDL